MYRIRDTTLREGIQIPGMHLDLAEKEHVVDLLYKAGIREIEIGIPNNIDACRNISKYITSKYDMKTSGIIQINRDNFREVIKQAKGVLDVVDLATPKLNQENFELYSKRLEEAISIAKHTGIRYGVAVMNATQTDDVLLKKIMKYKGDKFTFYDSKGIIIPEEITTRFKKFNSDHILFHGHNDYDNILENSLTALQTGAIGVDASILGMGARAGNLPLEEFARIIKNDSVLNIEALDELVTFFKKEKGFSRELITPFTGDLIFTETPVAHMISPESFRQDTAEIKYAFTLPVSYQEFIETIGVYTLDIENRLREATKTTGHPFPRGLSKKEVVSIINEGY